MTKEIEIINVEDLVARVKARRDAGCRLVQISATQLSGVVELTYSFDLDSQLSHLRLNLPANAALPSISGIFRCAVLYENEIHDLFGVSVDGLALDFKGNFYKTSIKYPFGIARIPGAAKPAASAPGAAERGITEPKK